MVGRLQLLLIASVIVVTAGCASSGSQKVDMERDSFKGTLRNYSYDIRIWWHGNECARREIRMRRHCGLCRGEVSRADLYDHDCDGKAEQFSHRAGDRVELSYADLEEEAWHAFYLIVPPARSGDTRSSLAR